MRQIEMHPPNVDFLQNKTPESFDRYEQLVKQKKNEYKTNFSEMKNMFINTLPHYSGN